MIFFFLLSLHNFQQAFCVCAAGCLIQLLECQRDQGESFAQANGDSIWQDQVSCLFVSKSVLQLVHLSEPPWQSCSSYGVVCISASVSSVGMQRLWPAGTYVLRGQSCNITTLNQAAMVWETLFMRRSNFLCFDPSVNHLCLFPVWFGISCWVSAVLHCKRGPRSLHNGMQLKRHQSDVQSVCAQLPASLDSWLMSTGYERNELSSVFHRSRHR
jgi:hypothetical protein